MPQPLTYPLNPADFALLVTHESLRKRGYCGLNVILIAELEGALDAGALAKAVRRLGEHYPALSARLCYVPVLHRPYWRIDSAARLAEAVQYEHHQLGPRQFSPQTQDADSIAETVNAHFCRALNDPVDLERGPHLRLVHVQTGEQSHHLALRWPHPLMDLEGAHHLLRALHEILSGQTPTLNADPRAVVPDPYNVKFPRSVFRAWRGRLLYAFHDRVRQPRVVTRPENAPQTCRFTLRHYSAAQRARFEMLTKKRLLPGPLLYSRATMIALARAYRQMATKHGRPRPRYLFPLPLPTPRAGPRPGVHGNHVVIPWIAFESAELDDWARADAAAVRQFREFHERRWDEATWCMYRAAARWPLGLTRWLTTHRRARAAAGLTGYQFDNSVTRLGTATITNLAAAGTMNCHPGWIVCRTTYGDTMSLSLTHFEDYFDAPHVPEFFDLLEHELFAE